MVFEQKHVLNSIAEKIKLFDAELKMLRHEKARISVIMKNADLRFVEQKQKLLETQSTLSRKAESVILIYYFFNQACNNI